MDKRENEPHYSYSFYSSYSWLRLYIYSQIIWNTQTFFYKTQQHAASCFIGYFDISPIGDASWPLSLPSILSVHVEQNDYGY